MGELIGWPVVLGTGIAIGCILMVANQVRRDLRNTAQNVMQTTKRVLADSEANASLKEKAHCRFGKRAAN